MSRDRQSIQSQVSVSVLTATLIERIPSHRMRMQSISGAFMHGAQCMSETSMGNAMISLCTPRIHIAVSSVMSSLPLIGGALLPAPRVNAGRKARSGET